MSGKQQDNIDIFMNWLVSAIGEIVWLIFSAIGILIVKLVRRSPEEKLRRMNRHPSYTQMSFVSCPRCTSINPSNQHDCSICHTPLPRSR